MTPTIPVLTVRIDRMRERRGTYELHIGRVLKVEHWGLIFRLPLFPKGRRELEFVAWNFICEERAT